MPEKTTGPGTSPQDDRAQDDGSEPRYRTLLLVEVLGDRPYSGGLSDLSAAVTDGDFSGTVLMDTTEEIPGALAAHLLIAQGSDPGFLALPDPRT